MSLLIHDGRLSTVFCPCMACEYQNSSGFALCTACEYQNSPGFAPCTPCEYQNSPGFAPCTACEYRNPPGFASCTACEYRNSPGFAPCTACEYQNSPGFAPCMPCEYQNSPGFALCMVCEHSNVIQIAIKRASARVSGDKCRTIRLPPHPPPAARSFIPAGCLEGVFDTPLHEVPGQTSLPRQGPSADAPSIRSGHKKCRTGFTAGPAPMKKVIDMNTPPKKEEILLCVSFMPCNPRATPGGSPR